MRNKAVKYISILLAVFLGLSCTLCVSAYILDPQNVYRWNDKGVRYYSPVYSTVAAAKNYDYNYAIIGSSMVQNMSAARFEKELGCRPLKITVGAMTPSELLWLYKFANEQNKASDYLVCLDLHRFAAATSIEPDSGRFPEHMYSGKGLVQFKYLLGFETWLRFIPLNILLSVNEIFPLPLPESFNRTISEATDINKMCQWDNTELIGKEKMYQSYLSNTVAFNEGNETEFTGNYAKNTQDFLTALLTELDENETLTLLLPPYSALYWAKETEKEMEILFDLREQIARFADEHENIILLDFQAEKYTTDLDKYIDFNHFGEEIQAQMETDILNVTIGYTCERIKQNSETIRNYALSAREQAAQYKTE